MERRWSKISRNKELIIGGRMEKKKQNLNNRTDILINMFMQEQRNTMDKSRFETILRELSILDEEYKVFFSNKENVAFDLSCYITEDYGKWVGNIDKCQDFLLHLKNVERIHETRNGIKEHIEALS